MSDINHTLLEVRYYVIRSPEETLAAQSVGQLLLNEPFARIYAKGPTQSLYLAERTWYSKFQTSNIHYQHISQDEAVEGGIVSIILLLKIPWSLTLLRSIGKHL